MTKKVATICVALLSVAGSLVATVRPPASAATPASGSLTYAHAAQNWAGSGLVGSAASRRTITCNANPNACDNFSLLIDTRLGGVRDPYATITLTLAPSTGAQMSILVYPPGCDPTTLDGPSCYTAYSTSATLTAPPDGTYVIQVACTACANSSYSMTGTLAHVVQTLPARGDLLQQFVIEPLADPTPQSGQLTTQHGEPAIWLNRRGDGIVNTFGPTLWVTHDGGKTWSTPTDILPQDTYCQSGYAGDADAVVGTDGTFYADNLCLGTVGGVNNEVFTNTAHGDPAQWHGPYLAGGQSDRQWLAPDPVDPNTVYFSYHDFAVTPPQNVEVYKSTDKGVTWLCPQTGAPAQAAPCPITAMAGGGGPSTGYPDTFSGNTTTRPMVDPTDHNSIYIPYAFSAFVQGTTAPPTRPDPDITRAAVAVSHDGGKTWAGNTTSDGRSYLLDTMDGTNFPVNASDDTTLAHIFIAGAMDTKGGMYLLFSVRLGGHTESHMYLMTSSNHGASWVGPTQVDSGGLNSNVFPSIAAGDPGRIALGWYGSYSHDYNDPTSQWSMMEASSTDALSAHPTFTQARMSSGSAAVHSADVCQAGTFCTVTGGNRDLADYQTGAVDPCGWAEFSYTDDHTGTGTTVVARQVSGTNLYAVNPCIPVTTSGGTVPATTGTTALANTAAGGAPTGAAVLVLLGASGTALHGRRRRTIAPASRPDGRVRG